MAAITHILCCPEWPSREAVYLSSPNYEMQVSRGSKLQQSEGSTQSRVNGPTLHTEKTKLIQVG